MTEWPLYVPEMKLWNKIKSQNCPGWLHFLSSALFKAVSCLCGAGSCRADAHHVRRVHTDVRSTDIHHPPRCTDDHIHHSVKAGGEFCSYRLLQPFHCGRKFWCRETESHVLQSKALWGTTSVLRLNISVIQSLTLNSAQSSCRFYNTTGICLFVFSFGNKNMPLLLLWSHFSITVKVSDIWCLWPELSFYRYRLSLFY